MLKIHNMPLILIIMISAILLLNPLIPLTTKEQLYAISLTIKSFILFLLPIVIFSLLFKTAIGLAQRATLIIAIILLCVCASNALSTFTSHFVGSWVYHFNLGIIQPTSTQTLSPAWQWQFPNWIANNKAMLLGILLGIGLGNVMPEFSRQVANKLDWVVSKILGCFIGLIPFFVAGFVVKLQFDGVMFTILKDYTAIFAIIAIAQFTYILSVYFALNSFKLKPFLFHIKQMLPAALAGFSAMSSAAVMPLTMNATEKNAHNKDLARSVIPATVNIHLVGDCFAIPIFAYAVMKSFGIPEPTLLMYLVFIFYFVLAKFSVAAIPGGGIIVMLPILENYLGFSPEMLSLMTALYILFDPVITSANILGNGGFAKFIDKLAQLRL